MTDIDKILLALDFGKTTDVIVKKTRFLAETVAAEVIPIHAVEIAALYSGSPVIDMQGIYQQVNSQLDGVKNSLVKNGVSVREVVIKDGNPKKLILELAEKLNVDLVILGAQMKSMIERLMGSTAEHVIRNSRKPVLCVHPQDSLGTIENVVCALDGSSPSSHTLNEAVNFCRLIKAKLQILHVIPYSKYYPSLGELRSPVSEWRHDVVPDVVSEYERKGKAIDQQEKAEFEHFLEKFDLSGLDHSHTVCRGYGAEEITRVAAEKGCDLLVMGAVDRRQATTFFTRGTIEKVLRKVPCSVLTIKHIGRDQRNRDTPQLEAIS